MSRYDTCTCPRQEVPASGGGLFCMSAQTRTDVLPYIFLILVCGYLLPGTSTSRVVGQSIRVADVVREAWKE